MRIERFPPKIIQGETSFTFDFNEEFEMPLLHKLFNLIIDKHGPQYGKVSGLFLQC